MKNDNDGSYRRDAQDKREYTDATYTTGAGESPMAEPRYIYEKPKREKPSRRGVAVPWVLLLCLICALIGGGGGVIGLRYLERQAAPAVIEGPVVESETGQKSGDPAPGGDSVMWAAPTIYTGKELPGADIYELGRPQVVGISTEVTTTNRYGQTSSQPVSGTGFIIRPDGYIVTNYHVIETALTKGLEVLVMLYGGESYEAQIIGYEKENDIAVLKIEADGLSAAVLGDSSEMRVGDQVYTIGNPFGELTYTMTSGILSAFNRSISTGDLTRINMFQFVAAVNPGNSGGPVYNSRGEIIGIVTAKYGSGSGVIYGSVEIEGLGFAIPVNDAIRIMNELIEKGYVTGKASIDVQVQNMDAVTAQYFNLPVGAYVYTVVPGGAAERAGILPGDIITGMNGQSIKSISDLLEAKRKYSAGDTVSMSVYRNGEELDMELTFSEEKPVSLEIGT